MSDCKWSDLASESVTIPSEWRAVRLTEEVKKGELVGKDNRGVYRRMESRYASRHVCRRGRVWTKYRVGTPMGVALKDIAKDELGWIQVSGTSSVRVYEEAYAVWDRAAHRSVYFQRASS